MRLVLFTGACVLAVGLAAGLAPLVLSRRMDMSDALKAGVLEGSVRRSRLRTTLLVMQGALSMLLLVGAGLFVRSLRNVAHLDLGFDPDRVMVAQVDLTGVVKGSDAFEDFWRRAVERLAALPSVGAVTQSVTTPLESGWTLDVALPGRDSLTPLANGPYIIAVSPEYFTTMGMRIVKGRGFTAADNAGSARVSVISDSMARYLFPGQEALGRCYYIVFGAVNNARDRTPCITVVGISQNTRVHDFRAAAAPEQYVPLAQAPKMLQWRVLMVRARDEVRPATTATDVRRALKSMEGNLPFADVRLLRQPLSLETHPWELGATMFGLFGALALIIAAVGLYSTIAYEMAQRDHEFGVRQALGAQRGDVGRLVVGRGLRYALPGLILGVGLALLATRAVRTLLFDISPLDPVVYVGVSVTLLAASLLAAVGPARRAWRVDPMTALREE